MNVPFQPHCYKHGIWAVLAPLVLWGCMARTMPIQLPVTALPTLNPMTTATPALQHLTQWWQPWHDPILNQLVSDVETQNMDIQAARDRLRQTRLELSFVDRQFLPELHFSTQNVVAPNGIDTFFQFGFDATWELNLFGRKQAQQRLAESQLLDQSAQTRAVLVSLTAEVVRSYRENQILAGQISQLQQWLHISQQRTDDVNKLIKLGLQQQQILWPIAQEQFQTQQQLDALKLQQQLNLWRLAILTGKQQPDPTWINPVPQPTPDLKLPHLSLAVLQSLPTVLNAQAKVLRTAGTLGLAQADLYPSISLTGGYFYSTNITRNRTLEGDINSAPAFGPNIDIPLLDFHKRIQHLRAEKVGLSASLLEYQSTVRQAWLDTHNDILQFNAEKHQWLNAEQHHTQYQQQQQLDQQRLHDGIGTVLAVLNDQLQQIQQSVQLNQSQMRFETAYLAVFKAVGGAFVTPADIYPAPQPGHSG